MKKSVIVAIIIAYIASILVVNFFGLKIEQFKGTSYITSITIDGVELPSRDNSYSDNLRYAKKLTNQSGSNGLYYGAYFISGTYDLTDENLDSNPNRVKILYNIEPYDASYTVLTYSYDKVNTSKFLYFDEETNEFVFIKPGTVTITLMANDGSTKKASVTITIV